MFFFTISPKFAPRQGNGYRKRYRSAIKSFGEKSEAGRAIILITDGENHEDDAIGATLNWRSKMEIVVHVIGMGNLMGRRYPWMEQ